jgi:hypothetical protein
MSRILIFTALFLSLNTYAGIVCDAENDSLPSKQLEVVLTGTPEAPAVKVKLFEPSQDVKLTTAESVSFTKYDTEEWDGNSYLVFNLKLKGDFISGDTNKVEWNFRVMSDYFSTEFPAEANFEDINSMVLLTNNQFVYYYFCHQN